MYTYEQFQSQQMTDEKFMVENKIEGVSPLFGSLSNLKSLVSRGKVQVIEMIDFGNGAVKNVYIDNQKRLVAVMVEQKK